MEEAGVNACFHCSCQDLSSLGFPVLLFLEAELYYKEMGLVDPLSSFALDSKCFWLQQGL